MEFVEVAKFGSRYEAETVGHALDQHGIPFFVQSADVGIFGPGMGGWSPVGAALRVPKDRVDEVAELLSCVVQPLAEGELYVADDTDAGEGAEAESVDEDDSDDAEGGR
ncbi:MAG: hypothetical protein AAGC60_06110 [Acidobacteriota bacterium]